MDVDDTWVFEETLGSGSFGIVQRWRNTHNGQKIAIKKCKSGYSQLTQRQKDRWIREVEIMNKLRHPNIIATKPVPSELENIHQSLPVLCMEYCKKGDLRRVLKESENCCGCAEPVAIQIMKDISGAVEYLHSLKLTHRDLKPENIVIQQIHDKVVYKLIDLGYAKELGHDSMYASIVGTLNYVAPELLWKQKYTCSVDYWSLGILFYEIITGYRPFLPDEIDPITWKKHVENKSYNDICAANVNGNIVFFQDIQDPTHIPLCLRKALVDWFRIVLQWDSKRRGWLHGDNGTNEIVVFKMLRHILSKKVVQIFCVSRYKIYCYAVDDTTTFNTLQSWIERDTQINISSQELIDSSGIVLKENDVLRDTFLTLFRKDAPLANSPELEQSTLVWNIIERPKEEMSTYELRRHYSAALFFAKKEVELFRYYILALSMKIDLINSSIDELLSKSCRMASEINLLKIDFHSTAELVRSDRNGIDKYQWQNEIAIVMKKLESLSEIGNDLEGRCVKFTQIRDTLRKFGDVNWMTEYEDFLNRVQDIRDTCQKLPARGKQQPIRMAMLMVKFLKLRQTQINDPKLSTIGSQIKLMTTAQVNEELSKFKKYVESAIALANVYHKEVFNLRKKWRNHRRAISSDINVENMDVESNNDDVHPSMSSMGSANERDSVNSDGVIYDNLVIRYMMHDVMSETYEKFLQIVNLNP